MLEETRDALFEVEVDLNRLTTLARAPCKLTGTIIPPFLLK